MSTTLSSPESASLKIVKASAGSGKTFSLTVHYLILLFSGARKYREILAVTFTEKATAEMKGRILQVLEGLAKRESRFDSYKSILISSLSWLDPEAIPEKADQIYRNILHDYSRFTVTTIDSFVQQVIRSFALELKLESGYGLEMNTVKVKEELVNLLEDRLDNEPELFEWIKDLALEQIRKDESWNYKRELLKLAGELFKESFQNFQELLRKAGNASENFVLNDLFKEYRDLSRKEIKLFEKELKEKSRGLQDLLDQSGLQTDELVKKTMHPIWKVGRIPDLKPKELHTYAKTLAGLEDETSWTKNRNIEILEVYQTFQYPLRSFLSFFESRFKAYQTAKAIEDVLDHLRLVSEMSDLLQKYRKENQVLLISDSQLLLRAIHEGQGDDLSFIWEKVGNRFRYFLFDEFQDTSPFQWDNFRPLLLNAMAETDSKLPDHLVVGDIKQAIYRWRNGDWKLLHQMEEQGGFRKEQLKIESLEENYRSSARIVQFNNLIFRLAPEILQEYVNKELDDSASSNPELENWWKQKKYDQIIPLIYANSQQALPKEHDPGGFLDVSFLSVENDGQRGARFREDAMEKLAETLCDWMREKRFEPGRVGILVRLRKEAVELVRFLLNYLSRLNASPEQENLSFQILSDEGLRISNNPAIDILINTLKGMMSMEQEQALFLATAGGLYAQISEKELSENDWLLFSSRKIEQLYAVLPAELCRNWNDWKFLNLAGLIEKLIQAFDLQTKAEHIPFLLAFRNLVADFTSRGEKGIQAFLDWWEEEGIHKNLVASEDQNAVRIMTIHKSKGLDFDAVMIPFCNWKLESAGSDSFLWVDTIDTPYESLQQLPVYYGGHLSLSSFAIPHQEERLFARIDALNMLYVACTRAKKHLYVTAPGFNSGKAGKEPPLNLAGDLIYAALERYKASADEIEFKQFNGMSLHLADSKTDMLKLEKKEKPETWQFQSYPLSDRLSDSLSNAQVWENLDLLTADKAKQTGIILHELMARLPADLDIDLVLRKMQHEGWFRESIKFEIKKTAEKVLNSKELQDLLIKPYLTYNEQSILNSKGEMYRPDKVLIGRDEVVLIDFKFSAQQKPEHRKQILYYKSLLGELGHQAIRAYLYYGFQNLLLEIS